VLNRNDRKTGAGRESFPLFRKRNKFEAKESGICGKQKLVELQLESTIGRLIPENRNRSKFQKFFLRFHQRSFVPK
jgi:hypothetical protein